MERLYTVSEIAEVLHLSLSTIYKYTESQKIPAIKLGNRLRITEAALAAYLNTCQTNIPQGGN